MKAFLMTSFAFLGTTGVLLALASIFIIAAIFMAVYNRGMPALVHSFDRNIKFREINYLESLSIVVLIAIVGAAF